MMAFNGLDIFPNNTKLAYTELLKDIPRHPATISHEPLPQLTRDGYQEFLISFNFDKWYEIDYADKKGCIRLETPIFDKVLRPCIDERLTQIRKENPAFGIRHDVSKDLRSRNINVYAEYFPEASNSKEKIFVYAISETDDLPWGPRIMLNTSKKSIGMLFRHFKGTVKEPMNDIRQLSIVPAIIRSQPIYNASMTPSGFQIDFVYQDIDKTNTDNKKEDWNGYSIINYFQMGRFMRLLDAPHAKKFVGRDISIYTVRNPGENKIIVCGIGSLDQYLKSVKF